MSGGPGSGAMFDAIAQRYDLLNRILSLGVDQGWRRRTVAALALLPGELALDLATGTGDLAMAIAASQASATVIGLDPSGGMLAVAREKIAAEGLAERITLTLGDAQALPFPSASVDAVSIAFGIRNVPDRPRALSEMARVLRPGGRLAILELGEPRGGLLGPLARFHVHTVVPRIGALLSGAPAYRYLEQSIARFPPAEEFAQSIAATGLRLRRVDALTFGVAHLYLAGKPTAGGPG